MNHITTVIITIGTLITFSEAFAIYAALPHTNTAPKHMEYLAKSPTNKILLESRTVTQMEPRWVFDKGRTPKRTEGRRPVQRNKDAKSKLQYTIRITKVNGGGSVRSKGPRNENTTLEEKEIATIEENAKVRKQLPRKQLEIGNFGKKTKVPKQNPVPEDKHAGGNRAIRGSPAAPSTPFVEMNHTS